MTIRQWLKKSALLATLGLSFLDMPVTLGQSTKKAFIKKLQQYDAARLKQRLAAYQPDSAAVKRIRKNMDVHTALLFPCAPKIYKKIAGLTSADGPELIQPTDDGFRVWQTEHQRYDTLRSIYGTISRPALLQIYTTYDEDNRDLVIHLGGTDFTSVRDLKNAGKTLLGGLSPRSVDAIDQADFAMDAFEARYGGGRSHDTNVSIVTHSAGAIALPGAIAAATMRGYAVNAAFVLAPFGADAAFDVAAEATGISKDIWTQSVTSITAVHGGILDYAKKVVHPVGNEDQCTSDGHFGAQFIRGFNTERVKQAGRTPRSVH